MYTESYLRVALTSQILFKKLNNISVFHSNKFLFL